jgi:hypothetical protein
MLIEGLIFVKEILPFPIAWAITIGVAYAILTTTRQNSKAVNPNIAIFSYFRGLFSGI